MPLFQGYIAYAPFPEGFQGDMDETFQQSGQLATIYISGNFLTGVYYPNGTTPPPTLPTSDQGPIALNGVWYFWDPVTNQYLPQSSSVKPAINFCKNATYAVAQTGATFTLAAAIAKTYDLTISRATQANVLAIAADVGPPATADNDTCASAIRYTVGPSLVTTPASSDCFSHEHQIEGCDIVMAQGQPLSVSFSIKVTAPGTYSGYLTGAAHDVSYVFSFSVATANQWARIKVNNIPAMPTSLGTWNFSEGQTGLYLGVTMAVGPQYQTTTTNQWISGFFAGTAANSNPLGVLNNQITISAVKLETGPSATYFSARSFEADYEDCIRYWWTNFAYQATTNQGNPMMSVLHNTNTAFLTLTFPKRMCKAPNAIPYGSTSVAPQRVTNISSSTDVIVTTLTAWPKGIGALLNISGLGAKGDVVNCYVSADARLN